MEFNPFDLSVKDLSTRNMITRCNSSEPLYTMCLPSHPTPSSPMSAPSALVASTSTWHRCLGHPGVDVLSKLSHDSSVVCSRCTQDLYHACQLVHHICLPFVSSNSCADNNFDLIHCGLWTSPVVSVSGSNIIWLSLMITSILCGLFLCALNLTLFCTSSKNFAYVSTQFGCTIKVVQCDNGHEFDNASSCIFFTTKQVLLWMSCPYTSPHNGKAKCILRTINNMLRSLLF
jgi:hypothetical protein